MKYFYTLLFLLCTLSIFAQQIERTVLQGQISSRTQNDVEGVTIYNNGSNKGTVTDANGVFELAVILGDELYVSAVQYAPFTLVVDEKMMQKQKIEIFLNPIVNALAEVLVKKIDLSGNLKVDVENIKTVALDTEWDLSWETLYNDYVFTDDRSSAIRGNVAQEVLGINNMPIIGVDFVELAKLIFPNKKKTPVQIEMSKRELFDTIKEKYPPHYLWTSFKIPTNKAEVFLLYLQEKGLSSTLLQPENEFEMFSFMQQGALSFKQLLDEEIQADN